MNTYILYWFDGKREIVKGDTPADAMNKAGIGRGALQALDFYEEMYVDDERKVNDWVYDERNHRWIKKWEWEC